MPNLHHALKTHTQRTHQIEYDHRQIARLIKVTKMETSQQEPRAVVGKPKPNPAFFIQIEESVFKRLNTLAMKEGIDTNRFGSELIKRLLLLHRTEVGRVIFEIKRRNHQCHAV